MSNFSSNLAEMNVRIGQTSFEELQAFHDQAVQQGGGEVRAKANQDGSFTLYVPKANKFSLRSLFGEGHGAVERQAKRDLAKNLVQDILSRQVPHHGVQSAMRPVAGQANLDLSQMMNTTRTARNTALPNAVLNQYGSLGQIQANPKLLDAFTAYLGAPRHASENIEFLTSCKSFDAAPNPYAKLRAAQDMLVMLPPMGGGALGFGQGPVTINITAATNNQLRAELAYLQGVIQEGQEPLPQDLARLEGLFNAAKGEISALIHNNGFVQAFTATPEFRELVGELYSENGFEIPGANPIAHLSPGSKLEFEQAKADFMQHEFPALHPAPNPAEVDRLVADRLFSREMDVAPNMAPNERGWHRFDGVELQSSGGATGSGRAKVGDRNYQVKSSIEHAGLGRRLKAGFKNHENYGEVIASNLSRSLVGPANQGLIPKVGLRQDFTRHEAVVTSEYLANGKGDLSSLYNERVGPLPQGQKHPKVTLDTGAQSGGGVLSLNGVAAQDVRSHIALSALMGDHDVNPGNMVALKDGRVGRIDFGHAFNELINGFGGRLTGGGGLHNSNNRILDFFNRETISGVTSNQQRPKLWRDYEGASASVGMTFALRELATSQTQTEGVAVAKAQFQDMIAGLEAEGTPEARKQIQDLTASLKKITQNIGAPVTSNDPAVVANEVFDKIELFIVEGQAMMMEVSNLSELQADVDHFIANHPAGTPIPVELQQNYELLLGSTVGLENGEGLTFMKMSREHAAFSGTLDQYVDERRAGRI